MTSHKGVLPLQFDCFDSAGTSIGQTFGRKKRDVSDMEEEVSVMKEIEVFDKDSPEFAEMLAQDGELCFLR